MAVRPEVALLEREAELAALGAALEAAAGGAGGLVVVEGPAGIGKTRLLREARERAARTGMRVLAARGSELERDFPFGVVRQLLEPAVLAADEREREELLAGAAAPARGLVGAEGDAGGDGASAHPFADPSFATLNALYWLVSNLAEGGPVLLAVDDAHWADSASLRLLRFLLPRLEELPVLLVVAARPSDPAADVELLARIAADPAARVLRPQALTREPVAGLVRAALGAQVDDAFCDACLEASGGNPFLLSELLAALAAEGSTGGREDAQHVREVAPASISRAVLVRLARLPEAARRLAHAVAVLGDDAAARDAAALAELDRALAAEAADALAGAGVLEAQRPLRFVHPLVRNAIYGDLPPGQRALAHERAAALLRAAGAEPERVAVHLLAADPDGDRSTVETLLAASRRALDRAAPEAAVRYLRRALAEPPPPELRTEVVKRLSIAAFRSPDRSAFGDADPIAELTADTDTLIVAAPTLTAALAADGRNDDIATLLDRAIAAARDAGRLEDALGLEVQRVTWTHTPPAEAQRRIAPYVEPLAGTHAEPALFALRAWWAMFTPGAHAHDAADLALRAIEHRRPLHDLVGIAQGPQAILVLLRAERLDVAERAIEQLAADANASGEAPAIAGAAFLRSELALLRGEVARAAAEAGAAVEAGRQGEFLWAVPIWLANLVEALVERDELDAADAALHADGMAGPLPRSYWFTPVVLARGRLRLAQGRMREAADDLLGAAADLDGVGISAPYHPWPADAACALTALGEQDEARRLLDARLGEARVWGTARPRAALLRAQGALTGDLDTLREAVAIADTPAARLEHAKALAELGAALRRANHRAAAREPLHAALDLARAGGALATARRAHAELEATGEKLRPLIAGGVESLTPSERRIADLAAEGRSNRDIAQSLFLTVKTVETHLSNAYRKLGIRSRRDLEAALSG
ncbi:MAG TPA: AAA family ATPase [Solirubrobacteraceae bacterium]|jgi:DNA-binding CsgD family transcriptional regulator